MGVRSGNARLYNGVQQTSLNLLVMVEIEEVPVQILYGELP